MNSKAGYSVNTVTDLNNITQPITITANSPANIPTELGGNRCMVINFDWGNDSYGAQIAFSFSEYMIAIRRRRGSTSWTAWKYLTAVNSSRVNLGTVVTNANGYYEIPSSVLPTTYDKILAVVPQHWSSTTPVGTWTVAKGNDTTKGGYIITNANTTITNCTITYIYYE